MSAKKISRREMLKGLGLAMAGTALAACAPKVVKETVVVEKPVEKVVKETVIVAGTPQVVEKVVTATPVPTKVYEVLYWEHNPWTRTPYPGKEKDIVWKYFLDNYNLDITLQSAPEAAADADAKLTAMIAAGEIPDFIQSYWYPGSSIVSQFITQGVLINIDDYLKGAPYLQTYLTDREWKFLMKGGKKYALAQPRPFKNWNTLWVRQDWLDKLGLEKPTTMDEVAEVGRALTAQDPDGDGMADTYGFTGTVNFGHMDCYMAPFGAWPGHNHVRIENNEVVFDAFSPQAKDAIAWWKAQIEAGSVDPDWSTNQTEQWRDAISQGKVGLPSSQFQQTRYCGSMACMGEAIEAATPEAEWVQLPAMKGPFGAYASWEGPPVDCRFWFTLQAKSEPGKMEAIMRLFNDVMNPESEAYKLSVYGVLNVTYWVDENGKRIERKKPPEYKYLSYWLVWRRGDGDYFWYYKKEPIFKGEPPALWDRQQFAISQPLISEVTPLVVYPEGWPDLEAYMQEMHMKFATGEESLDKWDDFINEAMTTYNLKGMLEDATEQMKEAGFIT